MYFYTYVLRSKKDGKLYTGVTRQLQKRLSEHNSGLTRSTKGRGPFELIYFEGCMIEEAAFIREKQLKSGHGKRYLKNRLGASYF
ncbi:MAG: GIY-YIG nuclease family protein [Candidatus Saccharibacteria bacterium]|nr:GIY-YIG nuclease family protein [Candidatus Saccharibacteria bacterium]